MGGRAEVFISATTRKLRSYREEIKNALLTFKILPIEERNFPLSYGPLVSMLRDLIGPCDAVIHLAGFYMWTLQLIRRLRRTRRRLFGPTLPHWAKDAASLFKYLNFLRLIPTIQVMVCGPNHFFKTVPSILKGKKKYYVSPLQFPINIAVLQIVLLKFLPTEIPLPGGTTLSQYLIIAVNLILALLSPLIMATSCFIILMAWYAASGRWPFGKLIPRDLLNCHAVMIP